MHKYCSKLSLTSGTGSFLPIKIGAARVASTHIVNLGGCFVVIAVFKHEVYDVFSPKHRLSQQVAYIK